LEQVVLGFARRSLAKKLGEAMGVGVTMMYKVCLPWGEKGLVKSERCEMRRGNEQEGKKGVSSVRLKEAEKKEMEKKKQFRSRSLWFFFFRRAQRKKPSSLLDNSGDGPQGIHAHPCPWPDNQ